MEPTSSFIAHDVSPAQVRAARALLDWTLVEAAEKIGVGRNTLNRIETGRSVPAARTMRDIVLIFEQAGIEFVTTGVARGAMLRFENQRTTTETS